jgi:acetyl esterase/lipase
VDDRTFESFSTFFTYDRRVPFDLKVVETKTDGGITVERLIFQSSPGIRVPAFLLHGANTTRRPGVVLLHSAGAKGKDLPNNMALGVLMARAGWSVIAIDLPYFGERATDLLTAYSDDEKHRRLYNQPSVYLGWMTQTVRDVGRAFDLLIERTHADAGRVALVGASRGAIAATVAAGVDRRFSPVVLLFGGHSTPSELDHLAPACPANYIARIAPRPLLMLNSVNDQTMLRGPSVQPLFALAGQPKDFIWTHGGHMVMTESNLAAVMSWLRRKME